MSETPELPSSDADVALRSGSGCALRRPDAPSNTLTTTAAIVTLAIGLGLTAVVFSLMNAVLLRPLAAPDPDRLVWVATRDDRSPFPMAMVVGPDFADWKAQARSFDRMVAYTIGDETVATSGTAALRARIAHVTDDFWSLSGARLEHGRLATATEGLALVVSHRFFETAFGGNPARLGGRVTVDGRAATIVGVLMRDFRFHFPPSPWLPEHQPVDAFSVMRVETTGRQMQLLNVVARLQPDVSLERARAEIGVLRARAARANPERPGHSAQLILSPLAEELVGGARRGLVVLFLAGTFVLLIVCANIAGLLLGRAARRHGEMAVRTSLGATRARLARQLLAESLVLAAFGTAAGVVLAQWGIRAAIALVPHAIPRLAEATIDGTVLLFTVGLGVATACLFTCGPLVPLWTTGAAEAPSEAGRHSTAARSPRLALFLAGTQIALAFVLLAGAGLLLKSFWRLHAYPPGFHPDRVLVLNIQLSGPRYEQAEQRKAYATSFLDAVQALPGVRGVSLSTHGDLISMLKVEGAAATCLGRTDGPLIDGDYVDVCGTRGRGWPRNPTAAAGCERTNPRRWSWSTRPSRGEISQAVIRLDDVLRSTRRGRVRSWEWWEMRRSPSSACLPRQRCSCLIPMGTCIVSAA